MAKTALEDKYEAVTIAVLDRVGITNYLRLFACESGREHLWGEAFA
jgi:hypothetical protein